MKLWIVTCVDVSDTCDSKARVLAACKSKDEAKAVVHDDMKHWIDQYPGERVTYNFSKMSAWHNDRDASCEWNIEEVEVK